MPITFRKSFRILPGVLFALLAATVTFVNRRIDG